MAAQIKITASDEKFIASMRKMAGSVGELTAKLNLGLNAGFKETNSLSRNLDRGFGQLASRFQSFGQTLSIGLTLPLALATKSASDAYAEYDSLRRGLQTFYPTIDGLNGRLTTMRELARLPGLGFQEAIQGDVRLQAVGITAEKSARILREFSNAVALTGGGKEKLNEVTIQLGQMAAKGKILNQDLRPIIENAPAVSTALQNLFGTVSSEDIANTLEKNGKDANDFISMLLDEMEKAPRVTGGWKNALENLSDSLFVARAEMFEVAEVAFGLSNRMDGASTFVENLVKSFVGLPQPLQAAIIGGTAFLGLLGPMSFAMGGLISFIPKLVAGLYTVQIAAGAATLGIGALVAIMVTLIGEQQAYESLLESSKTAHEESAAAVEKESERLNGYVTVLKSSTSTLEQKKSAKEALINISPSFLDILSNEKTDFEKLKNASYAYLQSLYDIESQKKLMSARDDIQSQMKSLSNGDITSVKTFGQGLWGVIKGLTALRGWSDQMIPANFQKGVAKGNADKLVVLANNLAQKDAEIAAVMGRILQAEGSKPTNPKLKPYSAGEGEGEKAAKAAAKAAEAAEADAKQAYSAEEKYRSMIRDGRQKYIDGLDRQAKQLAKAEDEIQGLLFRKEIPKAPVQKFTEGDPSLDRMIAGMGDRTMNMNRNFSKGEVDFETPREQMAVAIAGMKEDLKNFKANAVVTLSNIGADFVVGLVDGITSGNGFQGALKGLLNSLGGFVSEYGRKMLAVAIAIKLAKSAFSLVPGGPQSIGAAIGLIAAGGLMKSFASGIPALARGGVTNNPVMAMIGDNASGKEMVLPFERNNEFADAIANRIGGGGGGNFSHTIKLQGQDILIAIERAKKSL